jgi:hypothetical protein
VHVQEAGSRRQVQKAQSRQETRQHTHKHTHRLDRALVPRRARRTSPLSKRYAGMAAGFVLILLLPPAPASWGCFLPLLIETVDQFLT